MNNKGDITTTLIPIVALMLSLAALFALASFNSDLTSQSNDLKIISKDISFSHAYLLKLSEISAQQSITSSSNKETFKSIIEQKNIQFPNLIDQNNFFAKIRNNQFTFNKENNNYKLKIEDLFIQSELNNNKIKRSFNICMLFDSQGNKIENC